MQLPLCRGDCQRRVFQPRWALPRSAVKWSSESKYGNRGTQWHATVDGHQRCSGSSMTSCNRTGPGVTGESSDLK